MSRTGTKKARELNEEIRYTSWSVFKAVAELPEDEGLRSGYAEEVEQLFAKLAADLDVVVRGTYDTAGMRADADLMIWAHAPSAEALQELYSSFRKTLLGQCCEPAWTGMARLVRGDFLTLREREFVDAARLAGASNRRIIFKHILPNAIGVITVNTTLLMSSAILLETALSYLGMGVRPPDTSLGRLISENQAAFQTRPWLFWWPGLFIVIICLCINFIGDGLRDAFDPRQKKLVLKRVKEPDFDPLLEATQASALPGMPLSEIVAAPAAAGGPTTTIQFDEDGR